MQTNSQASAKPKKVREPHEGNLLWKLYRELGATRVAEFRTLLKDRKMAWATFLTDTHATRKIGGIRAERLQVYRDFFMEGGPDLFEAVRQEQAATPPVPTSEPAEA